MRRFSAPGSRSDRVFDRTPDHGSTPPDSSRRHRRRHTTAALNTATAVHRRMLGGRSSGSTRRTSVRSSMSAKVRRRESHSGHSHPTNTEWCRAGGPGPAAAAATARWSSRRDAPPQSRQSARPKLQPVTVGSTQPVDQHQQDGYPAEPRRTPTTTRCAAAPSKTTNAIVAATAIHREGRRQRVRRREDARAPSHPAVTSWTTAVRSRVLFDHHRHFVTWSSLEIRYWPSSGAIFTRRR